MKKISEDENIVKYSFDMDIQDEKITDKQKNTYCKMKIAYGFCSFNKKTKVFIIDREKTDPYFLTNKWATDRVNIQLLRHLKENYFPEITQYAA